MLYLVCGGASSGKSEYAENLCINLCDVNLKRYYIATMICYDEESKKRIELHRQKRQHKGFETIEAPFDISKISDKITQNDILLIECLSNLVANEMYEKCVNPKILAEKIFDEITLLCGKAKDVVIVSNSVFSSGEDIKDYSRELGKLNCLLAQRANFVAEICADCPVVHKNTTITLNKTEEVI